MRRNGWSWLVLVAATALALEFPAFAVCLPQTKSQAVARANLIFEGFALEGPTLGTQGTLLSPARFRVERYIKGAGPEVVEVETGLRQEGDRTIAIEDRINPKVGELWRIYVRGPTEGILQTSVCVGSHRVGDREPFSDDLPRTGPPPAGVLLATGLALIIAGVLVRSRVRNSR